jgi:polyisoprenoid-binding protein YceI
MSPSEQATALALEELLEDAALAGEWFLDPARSSISLTNKSLWGLVPVRGVFRQVTGQGVVSPPGEVNGTMTVRAASVDTKHARRDTHLRSADFFDSDNHPEVVYTVDGIRPAGAGVTVSGTLKVRDCTRPVGFNGTAETSADGEVWLDAKVPISQGDFGLTWNLMGTIGKTTTITIHAVFTKA